MLAALLTAPLLLSAALQQPIAAPSAPLPGGAAAEAEESLGARVAILGASASAGFVWPLGARPKVPLAEVFEEMLLEEHAPVVSAATENVFLNPKEISRDLWEQARAADPTLVVAVDFLFWYVYGAKDEEDDRLADLEDGLKLLDQLDCRIVVGDVPYMKDAIGGMLREHQVPRPATLDKANRRIREWVAAHPNVVLVSLGDELARLEAERQDGDPELLQSDRLHPTVYGSAILAARILEAAVERWPDVSADQFMLDPMIAAEVLGE